MPTDTLACFAHAGAKHRIGGYLVPGQTAARECCEPVLRFWLFATRKIPSLVRETTQFPPPSEGFCCAPFLHASPCTCSRFGGNSGSWMCGVIMLTVLSTSVGPAVLPPLRCKRLQACPVRAVAVHKERRSSASPTHLERLRQDLRPSWPHPVIAHIHPRQPTEGGESMAYVVTTVTLDSVEGQVQGLEGGGGGELQHSQQHAHASVRDGVAVHTQVPQRRYTFQRHR
mmetsp:Transcript_2907/g.5346  ORF Transcript_2907/g.5346 Transcript_2907/m.5346 type:complete len:228 (-) Transcript_2907:953-1636(-)